MGAPVFQLNQRTKHRLLREEKLVVSSTTAMHAPPPAGYKRLGLVRFISYHLRQPNASLSYTPTYRMYCTWYGMHYRYSRIRHLGFLVSIRVSCGCTHALANKTQHSRRPPPPLPPAAHKKIHVTPRAARCLLHYFVLVPRRFVCFSSLSPYYFIFISNCLVEFNHACILYCCCTAVNHSWIVWNEK